MLEFSSDNNFYKETVILSLKTIFDHVCQFNFPKDERSTLKVQNDRAEREHLYLRPGQDNSLQVNPWNERFKSFKQEISWEQLTATAGEEGWAWSHEYPASSCSHVTCSDRPLKNGWMD